MASLHGFSIEPWGSSKIGNFKVPGSSVSLTVRKEIAPILIGFCRDFHREVEPLRKGWCWGFNPKKIEGSNSWSNHAWGGAVDLNAPRHPMGKANTFTLGERAAIDRLLKKYTFKGQRLIRAGKDYSGRKDDMHFEINVSRSIALAAVAALGTATPVTAGSRTLRRGDKGADVKVLQSKLGIKADGDFGPDTEAKLKAKQKALGLEPDGVAGPKTWAKLGIK
jgi:hypothetical protein